MLLLAKTTPRKHPPTYYTQWVDKTQKHALILFLLFLFARW